MSVDQALACIHFVYGAAGLVRPVGETKTPVERERLFDCNAFRLWQLRREAPFAIEGGPRVLLCIEGSGRIEHGGDTYRRKVGSMALASCDWIMHLSAGQCDRCAGDRSTGIDITNCCEMASQSSETSTETASVQGMGSE